MEDKPEVSVVVPVYNAARTLEMLCDRCIAVLKGAEIRFEIILVDDASRDQSWQIINKLCTDHPSVIAGFQLVKNSGQQVATLCGMQQSHGLWVVTIDDDLQINPEDILTLLHQAKAARADVVYGYFPNLNHSRIHNAGSRLFYRVLKMVAPECPAGSSFRLIASALIKLFPINLGPWIFIDPVLAWFSSCTIRVPVTHQKSSHGRSRYSFLKLVRLACQVLIVYSNKPFRMISWFALLSALVSFLTGVYFIIQKITVGAQLGFSSLIVAISFSASMILLSLGILGEYIFRIYAMKMGRPAFTVKNTV